jgi:hypothetical protein
MSLCNNCHARKLLETHNPSNLSMLGHYNRLLLEMQNMIVQLHKHGKNHDQAVKEIEVLSGKAQQMAAQMQNLQTIYDQAVAEIKALPGEAQKMGNTSKHTILQAQVGQFDPSKLGDEWWRRSCSELGINQVYGACVFAALATLWYRVPRLYELMSKDIQQWVFESCQNNFAMQDVEDLNCPALPQSFWRSYSELMQQKTIYEGNWYMAAVRHFLIHSSVNFQEVSATVFLNKKSLQIWLDSPQMSADTVIYNTPPNETPHLSLIGGCVTIDTKTTSQEVLRALCKACLQKPAYGGLITTRYGESKGDHTFAFNMCNPVDFRICSYGACWSVALDDDDIDNPLHLNDAEQDTLKALDFVLLCETRQSLPISLEVFEKHVLEDFADYMIGSDDMPDNMPDIMPDAVFQRTAFLTPPVKVTYTSNVAWPDGIEKKCLEYHQIVSGIFISVEPRRDKEILDVTFREVVAPVHAISTPATIAWHLRR